MTRRLLGLAGIALIMALASGMRVADADPDTPIRMEVASVDVSAYPSLRLLISSLDREGQPVPGLTAGDFTLAIGNDSFKATAVQSRSDAGVPVWTLLVMDTSGSMGGAPLEAARQAASLFLASSTSKDQTAIMSFSDDTRLVSDFTPDVGALQRALIGLSARGTTALYKAVVDAATKASTQSSERRYVLLLSDGGLGGEGRDTVTRQLSLDTAARLGVPFYTIGFGSQIDQKYMQELADVTGGRFFNAPDAIRLRDAYSEIARFFRSQYVVTVPLRPDLHDETKAKLTLASNSGSGTADVTINLPLAAPPPPVPITTAPAPASSGSPVGTILALLAVFAVLGGGGFLVVRRRLASREAFAPTHSGPVLDFSATTQRTSRAREQLARLVLPDGTALSLGNFVTTLGTDNQSTYQMPLSAADVGPQPLRVWQANGRFVFHDLAPRVRARVNGRPTAWTYLNDGDVIEIGGLQLRFELLAAPAVVRPDVLSSEGTT